jgi:hypothetical protein
VIDLLVSKDLEFRGINHADLGMYFIELGGEQMTESFPYVYEGDGWRGEVLSEEELAFTSVFTVNAVKVRFSALNEVVLENLIKDYRLKTFRVGG